MIALLVLTLAAAPQADSIGSVDGPFLWVDAHGSVDSTSFATPITSYTSLSAAFASGISVLGQGQLFGGWGLRVLDRRLTIASSLTATGVAADTQTSPDYPGHSTSPRFDVSPLWVSAAMTLPFDGVVLVPMLGATLPTRGSFYTEPIVALQPQLSVRASVGGFLFGGSVLLNVPAITAWRPPEEYDVYPAARRCPPDVTRCRLPVARELWRAALSLQGEYWFERGLSVGARASVERREEDVAQLLNSQPGFGPEGSIDRGPQWSLLEARGSIFGTWAFSQHFGLSGVIGAGSNTRAGRHGTLVGHSWDATLSIWFRTDSRLNRFWLDR